MFSVLASFRDVDLILAHLHCRHISCPMTWIVKDVSDCRSGRRTINGPQRTCNNEKQSS